MTREEKNFWWVVFLGKKTLLSKLYSVLPLLFFCPFLPNDGIYLVHCWIPWVHSGPRYASEGCDEMQLRTRYRYWIPTIT